jgi:ferric-dicitrate binding protein FerR (iron transport regulator)
LKANEYHINDELLVKYLLAEATPGERQAVDHWVNISAENKKYFQHFQLIWETSKQLVIPSTVNADDAWKRFQQRTEQASKRPAVVKPINSSFTWVRAASVAILIIGITVLMYFLSNSSSLAPVVVAASSNPVTDTLPDGSSVTLNRNSSIRYPEKFKGQTRNVELKGEAFFAITPDKKKPFVINVNDITVTVVGTSFNIKSIAGETQVVVETGIVRVTKNNKTIELRAREKVVVKDNDSVLLKVEATDRLHQYYHSKQFVCDNTPLWKLVEVLNEAYNSNIVIQRNELRTLPLTTTFNNESLDKILSIIAETFDLTVEKTENQISLK